MRGSCGAATMTQATNAAITTRPRAPQIQGMIVSSLWASASPTNSPDVSESSMRRALRYAGAGINATTTVGRSALARGRGRHAWVWRRRNERTVEAAADLDHRHHQDRDRQGGEDGRGGRSQAPES